MKIAVCVKQVPEGNSRIDPGTMRLDRSGEGALNGFDANAVEEALRLRDATGEGEVVLVSLGPAKAQDALQWRVEAKVTPMPDGARRVDVVARDAAGQPLRGMTLSAVFERPIDRRLDRGITITEDSPGRFHGSADIASGQWDLVIELSRQGDRQFRSRNRVVLK